MSCTVCGKRDFTMAEYRLESGRVVPALECTNCGTLKLSERVATSAEERDSIRRAISGRSPGTASDGAGSWTPAGAWTPSRGLDA
jgi:hypothetical protein